MECEQIPSRRRHRMGCASGTGECVRLNDQCSLFGYSVCRRPELCDGNEWEGMHIGRSTNVHERQTRMGRSTSRRFVHWLKHKSRQLTCSMNMKVGIDDTTQLLGEH